MNDTVNGTKGKSQDLEEQNIVGIFETELTFAFA